MGVRILFATSHIVRTSVPSILSKTYKARIGLTAFLVRKVNILEVAVIRFTITCITSTEKDTINYNKYYKE